MTVIALSFDPVTDDAVFGLAAAAKAEGAFLTPSPSTRFYALTLDDETLAVIGLTWHGRRHARIRGHYVPPSLRGHGYGGSALDLAISEAFGEGAKEVSAAIKPWLAPVYERRGFTRRRSYLNGQVEMVKRV